MRTPYLPAETLPDEDWWGDDAALRRFLARRLPPEELAELRPRLASIGTVAPRVLDPLARQADANGPRLVEGRVEYDPSYRELQRLAREHRVFTHAWHGGSRLAAFALGYLYAQAECGYYCPACMTDGAAWVLSRRAGFEGIVARLVQPAADGALEGAMFLTERAGGSDVGATETMARQAADGSWRLTGDKWFCSNADAGAVLTLARMPDGAAGTRGLGLFLLEGPNAGMRLVKLKDKLGVRSMATGEYELRDAPARLVEGEGKGFLAMAEMVNLSRLYNAVASVAIARRALREGQKNARWREAFGRKLADHPLYVQGLAALAVDVRGALFFTLDTAVAFEKDPKLARALTPLAKAETARLAVRAASDACEMLGGNGYVKPWVTERLLRDAQVLPIWEGTTNVQALDLMRACLKDGAAETIAVDSQKRAPALIGAWDSWLRATKRIDERSSLRLLSEGYHLRCATLLQEDADDEEGRAFEAGYLLRNVLRDGVRFEQLAGESGRLLGAI